LFKLVCKLKGSRDGVCQTISKEIKELKDNLLNLFPDEKDKLK